ncbi:uncharacterized protein LOC115594274 [Sparus aurata]|uniref:uncharacterized protein LOC115594274 n=1 Tax=Sparus aurata TaxID=8175 RepID=UPI0011C170CB|nr:uncharacterized protein LOC115594274 [Sparus aurata]
MAEVAEFVKAPAEELLDKCTKEQLLKIAEHYDIDISDKRLKDTVKSILRANLSEMGVLTGGAQPLGLDKVEGLASPVVTVGGLSSLTFEQQRELLLLQLEHDKIMKTAEMDKQIAVEKLRYQTEQTKLSLEQSRLELLKGGSSVAGVSGEQESSSVHPGGGGDGFDVLGNLRLLPKFNEKDPETFFSLFERVAASRKWPESARTLMLQCVLTGRAQEAYSSLSFVDSQSYSVVKSAVLKVYELVPEAYRQRFRTWRKAEKQTHLEFARDLSVHFTRWCAALAVENFEDLCDLIVLEQFKNSIPDNIATHIGDQKVNTAIEAAALADDYVLTHRRAFGEGRARGSGSVESVGVGDYPPVYPARADMRFRGVRGAEKICNFCHKKGHWKVDCYVLKAKAKQPMTHVKGACMAVSAPEVHGVHLNNGVLQRDVAAGELNAFLPFVSSGFVSLVGSDEKVPVKILRDTAAFDSFIQASVLPFSEKSDTGLTIPVLGVGMQILQVPLHNIQLFSDLVQGQVAVGVRPALPIGGITLILGNGVAGSRVWADDSPPPLVVSSVPLVSTHPDECEVNFPEVFTACAVTRAMAHADAAVHVRASKGERHDASELVAFSMSDVPLSVSLEDLKTEQKADPSLAVLFE